MASAQKKSATANDYRISKDMLVLLVGFPPRDFLTEVYSTKGQARVRFQLLCRLSGHLTAHKVLTPHLIQNPVAKLFSSCFSLHF
jgi:hypothetical protein